MEIRPIAHIRSGFTEKFGIPRQSGLVKVSSQIVFEPEYRVAEAFRGIEGYSHLWIVWQFSEAVREEWSPTVRPPRLGGNRRMGVFATRSPFRPNSLGLSSVRIERIDLNTAEGPIITVSGGDMMNGTPVFDIKPYLAYTDSHPDAESGFALSETGDIMTVDASVLSGTDPDLRDEITAVLAQDPRPQYIDDSERIYTFAYRGYDISFRADKRTITVTEIKKLT